MPDDGRGISQNIAYFNILIHDVINLLYYKRFITRLKTEKFKIISFNVKSLFTNVPLEETIHIILNKIYDEKKIETNIPLNIMKDLLYLCTKHFF